MLTELEFYQSLHDGDVYAQILGRAIRDSNNPLALTNIFNSPAFNNLKFREFELDKILEEQPYALVVEESKRVKSIITDIYKNNDLLYTIEPRHFEEVVAELLSKRNFKVELTKQTRDGGYDILAIQEMGGYPTKYLVECKRHAKKRPVDIAIVRSFLHVIGAEQANKGLIVTTSYFSPDAEKEQQKYPYLLHFHDQLDLLKWVQQYKTSK